MRQNTKKAYDAWVKGKVYRSGGAAIWTDGKSIFSYGTILIKVQGFQVHFDTRTYSKTTSTHQNSLRELLNGAGISWQQMDDNS